MSPVYCLWSAFVPVFCLYAVDGSALEKTKITRYRVFVEVVTTSTNIMLVMAMMKANHNRPAEVDSLDVEQIVQC